MLYTEELFAYGSQMHKKTILSTDGSTFRSGGVQNMNEAASIIIVITGVMVVVVSSGTGTATITVGGATSRRRGRRASSVTEGTSAAVFTGAMMGASATAAIGARECSGCPGRPL